MGNVIVTGGVALSYHAVFLGSNGTGVVEGRHTWRKGDSS